MSFLPDGYHSPDTKFLTKTAANVSIALAVGLASYIVFELIYAAYDYLANPVAPGRIEFPLPAGPSFSEPPSYKLIKDAVAKHVSDRIAAHSDTPGPVWDEFVEQNDLVSAEYLLKVRQGGIPFLRPEHLFKYHRFSNFSDTYLRFFAESALEKLPFMKLLMTSEIMCPELVMTDLLEMSCSPYGGAETFEYFASICSDVEAAEFLRKTAEKDFCEYIPYLLKNHEFEPSFLFEMLKEATRNTSLSAFKALFQDHRIDPTLENGIILRLILTKAYENVGSSWIEMLKLVLDDGRIDPRVNDNEAVVLAAKIPNIRSVLLLLADDRVDPSAQNDAALKNALNLDEEFIVYKLLSNPRVSPADLSKEQLIDLKLDRELLEQTTEDFLKLPNPDDLSKDECIARALKDQCEHPLDINTCRLYFSRSKERTWYPVVMKILAENYWPDIQEADLPAAFEIIPAVSIKDWQLLPYARNGNLVGVKLLLKLPGIDPYYCSVPNKQGNLGTALHWAAAKNHLDIVNLLLDETENPPDRVDEALLWACEAGATDVVQYLLNSYRIQQVDEKCLWRSVFNHHPMVTDLLLQSPKLPYRINMSELDREKAYLEVNALESLLSDKRFENYDATKVYKVCFKDACRSHTLDTVKALIAKEKVDLQDHQLLQVAARDPEILKFLLETDQVDMSFDSWYVLRQAILERNLEVLKIFLADPKVDPNSVTVWSLLNVGYDLLILQQMTSDQVILEAEEGETLAKTAARYIVKFGMEDDRCDVYLRRNMDQPWHMDCFKECFKTMLSLPFEAHGGFETVMKKFYGYWFVDRIPLKKLAKAYMNLFGLTKAGEGVAQRMPFDVALMLVPYLLE